MRRSTRLAAPPDRALCGQTLDGLIVGATTGEGLTLDDAEIEQLVMLTATAQRDFGLRVPLVLGVSGSDTRKVTKWLARTADWPLDGYLIACPYYTRPSQAGLMLHFEACRRHGAADHDLQHPVSDRGQSRQRNADPRASQHGDRGLRDHRHVDDRSVPGFQCVQYICKLRNELV